MDPALRIQDGSAIWTLDDILEPSVCAKLIACAQRTDWLTETIDVPGLPRRLRTPATLDALGALEQFPFSVVEDPTLALRLFYRIEHALPRHLGEGQLSGLKPTLRILRYGPGEGTDLHADPVRTDGGQNRSELTLLVYLNDNFEGGDTEFPELGVEVAPAAGRGVVFPHAAAHRGRPVTRGTKYVLRTDVFYNAGWHDLPPL